MDIEDAIEMCDEICDFIEDNILELNDNGQEFFEDVKTKVISMQETLCSMRDNGRTEATSAQERALNNWDSGLHNWVHD